MFLFDLLLSIKTIIVKRKAFNIKFYCVSVTFVLILISLVLPAQIIKTNLQLLKENKSNGLINMPLNHKQLNNTKPIEYKKNGFIYKFNPISLTFTGSMLLYQHLVSQQLFKHCIYEMSCSNFSKQAIHHFGIIKGVFLSADRLMRCNAMVKEEIPPYEFDKNGLAVDEPNKYDTH
jgi:uncharacterized protein